MNEWLLLLGAKGLKAVIMGGLSALSFGVDVLSTVPNRPRTSESCAVVVRVCEAEPAVAQALAQSLRLECHAACTEEPWARILEGKVQDASRPDVLVQMGALVPPILVEALFPPDLLLPHPGFAEPRAEVPSPPARPRA